MRTGEYGALGTYGILTPQGNPTVEPELRVLLPPKTTMLVSRLVSPETSLKDRLAGYLIDLHRTLENFDMLTFDAVGFACTGSSYLVSVNDERRLLEEAETRFGYPVVTAAGAVALALKTLGVRRLALISPYPEWLTAASSGHWTRLGYTMAKIVTIPGGTPDRHGIYGLTTPNVLAASEELVGVDADAVLITGTGMPSLRGILALEPKLRVPILSSNLCLAWALARIKGLASAGQESRLYGGWADRLGLA